MSAPRPFESRTAEARHVGRCRIYPVCASDRRGKTACAASPMGRSAVVKAAAISRNLLPVAQDAWDSGATLRGHRRSGGPAMQATGCVWRAGAPTSDWT